MKAAKEPARVQTLGSHGPAVKLQGAGYSYGRRAAFEAVDLCIGPGEFYALLGRNGAGKSTLLSCVLGFRRALGSCEVFGLDAWTERRRLMRQVAYVPETPNVPPFLSARGAARLCAWLGGSGDGEWATGGFDRALFERQLEAAAIPPRRWFRSLSRGQQNQVGMALALASRPRLLLLDDPTLGLDAVARRRLYRTLIEQQEAGVTIVTATHDLSALDGIATHVGFLHEGRLALSGAVDDLKSRYRIGVGAGDVLPPGSTLVRTWQTALGSRCLVDLGSDASSHSLDYDQPPWSVPSIEELYLALLDDESYDWRLPMDPVAQSVA